MNLKMRVSAFRKSARFACDAGSAAIEFAFIAPVFFALMLGILEIGVMTFAQFALQNSVTDAARMMRTGQVNQTAKLIQDGTAVNTCGADSNSDQIQFASEGQYFKQQICCGVQPLISGPTCKSDVVVTVAAPPAGFNGNFNALGTAGTYFGKTTDDTKDRAPVAADTACQIVMVRANYNWPIWFPGLAKILNTDLPDNYLSNPPGGSTRLLSGLAAFRTEPFNTGVAGC